MKIFAVAFIFSTFANPVMAADPPLHQVTITEYMYEPATLTVTVGSTVTWVNHDEVPHTIVESSTEKSFHSAALDTDETYSYTFTKAGTYHYYCNLHPKMVGTIIVAAGP